MTLQETKKLANPRQDDHIANCKGTLYFIGPKPPESMTFRAVTDREVCDTITWNKASQSDIDQYEVQDRALGAVLAHCYNHFDEVVEALKKTQELYSDLVLVQKLRERSKSGIYEDSLDERSEANVKLLASVNEVRLS